MSDHAPTRFTYTCDTVRRLVHVVAQQPLASDDLVAIIDRQRQEGSWSFGILYDLRRTDGATSHADAAKVAEHVAQSISAHGPRGPVALVTRKTDMVASGQIYAIRTSPSMNVEVFWDLQEADAWLAARLTAAAELQGTK